MTDNRNEDKEMSEGYNINQSYIDDIDEEPCAKIEPEEKKNGVLKRIFRKLMNSLGVSIGLIWHGRWSYIVYYDDECMRNDFDVYCTECGHIEECTDREEAEILMREWKHCPICGMRADAEYK